MVLVVGLVYVTNASNFYCKNDLWKAERDHVINTADNGLPLTNITIVATYGLKDWSSIPDRGKNSFRCNVQTSSGVHPASYPMGTGTVSQGNKLRGA
jgi:hypothetical protein